MCDSIVIIVLPFFLLSGSTESYIFPFALAPLSHGASPPRSGLTPVTG